MRRVSVSPQVNRQLLPRRPGRFSRWSRGFSKAFVLSVALPAVLVAAQERVISTDASITDVVFALGAGERLVGVDVTSALPDSHLDIERVGYHRALSAEGLLSLSPDLLLMSEHAGPAKVIEQLSGIGVRIARLPAPMSPAQLRDNIAAVAEVLDVDSKESRQRVQTLERRLSAKRIDQEPSLLVRERDGVLRVAGRGTAGDGFIRLLGGRGVAEFDGYRSFSQEALLDVNPELLLVAVGTAELHQGKDAWLKRYPLMQHLSAVSTGRWALVPAEVLVGGVSFAAMETADALLQELQTLEVAMP